MFLFFRLTNGFLLVSFLIYLLYFFKSGRITIKCFFLQNHPEYYVSYDICHSVPEKIAARNMDVVPVLQLANTEGSYMEVPT